MKKQSPLFVLLFGFQVLIFSQNIQVHYDFGAKRNYVTTTVEFFKQDKVGNTFFFVDFDFNKQAFSENSEQKRNIGLAYMEIARSFIFSPKVPLSAHLEYNGGLLASGKNAFAIHNSFLAGLAYNWNDKGLNYFITLQGLYKYIMGKHNASFQLTAVWELNFFKKRFTISGFADFWRENTLNFYNYKGGEIEAKSGKFVFISEPQFWYNITPHVAIGTEIEMAYNFGAVSGFKVCPTLGAKWTF